MIFDRVNIFIFIECQSYGTYRHLALTQLTYYFKLIQFSHTVSYIGFYCIQHKMFSVALLDVEISDVQILSEEPEC